MPTSTVSAASFAAIPAGPRSFAAARGTLYALALATFAIGTEGFMIAAILLTISRSLSVSVAAVGQLVTVFALVYAFSSPILTATTGGIGRRPLLIYSLLAFSAANLVAAAAPGYWSLGAARVLLALAAGLFVPNANALAGALVEPSERGRALAIVNGGFTVAVALGVPLGALVGASLGWRSTFIAVASLSCVALAVLVARLPRDIPAMTPANLRQRFATALLPGVLPVLTTTMLWATGAYVVFTYVALFMVAATGIAARSIGWMLFLLGTSAVVGIAASGRANDRFGARRVIATLLPIMAVAFLGLTVAALLLSPRGLLAIVPLIMLWGISAWGFIPPQQHRLIELAGTQATPVILSLNSSFMYIGFAVGAAAGSAVISVASVEWIGAAGAAFVMVAMAASRYAWSRAPSERQTR